MTEVDGPDPAGGGWLTLDVLHPEPTASVEAVDAYAWPRVPWLRANMVASVDGAATLDGRVGTLTGPADQHLLLLLRAMADVLVVGAGTLRAEGYGALTVDPALAPLRRLEGMRPAPRLVVPTRSLDLDPSGPPSPRPSSRPWSSRAAAALPTVSPASARWPRSSSSGSGTWTCERWSSTCTPWATTGS